MRAVDLTKHPTQPGFIIESASQCGGSPALSDRELYTFQQQIYAPAALLGGFAALTGKIALDSVVAAIREKFAGKVAEANAAAAAEAYERLAHAEAG